MPDLDPDEAPLLGALASRGVDAVPAVWDDPEVDWSVFDLVVIRSTWDYVARRGDFLAWAEGLPRVLNSPAVLRWNTDKHYLAELEAAGVPIVPTTWLDPDQHLSSRALHTRFPAGGEFVLKPAIGAGAKDSGRYVAGNAAQRSLAIQHASRLLAEDRAVMVQRYVRAVDTRGETALVFLDGTFSHAVRKAAMLHGTQASVPEQVYGTEELYRQEKMSATVATDEELAIARAVLDTTRDVLGLETPPLYARVDLVPADDGSPLLMELELTEPALFLGLADGALDRVADAIAWRTKQL